MVCKHAVPPLPRVGGVCLCQRAESRTGLFCGAPSFVLLSFPYPLDPPRSPFPYSKHLRWDPHDAPATRLAATSSSITRCPKVRSQRAANSVPVTDAVH